MDISIKEHLSTYEYWLSKLNEGKKLIMSPDDINKFNEKIIFEVDTVYDLEKYEEILKKEKLIAFIKEYKIPSRTMYDDSGKELSKDFLKGLEDNLNIEAISYENKIRYAIAVNKTTIRSFPTEVGAYHSADPYEFDRFQESACEFCEPLLILHQSKDKQWYFIQTYNYRGWTKVDNIAEAENKEQIIECINAKEFLIVTGNHISTKDDLKLNMGDKLILNSKSSLYESYKENYYIIKMPIKTKQGTLNFKDGLIGKMEDVTVGYLPYDRENIIRQAFKLLGDKYDWGNKYVGRDCSGFIACVYKTFGIMLPRNAGEQESCTGIKYKFNEVDSIDKRVSILDEIQPGAAIFKPGHVMMYLGKEDGEHYMIHDFAFSGKKEGLGYVAVPVFRVAVTSTMLTQTSGDPYIQDFTSAVQYEF